MLSTDESLWIRWRGYYTTHWEGQEPPQRTSLTQQLLARLTAVLGGPNTVLLPTMLDSQGHAAQPSMRNLGTRAQTQTNSFVSSSVYLQEGVSSRWSLLPTDRSCRLRWSSKAAVSTGKRQMGPVESLPAPPQAPSCLKHQQGQGRQHPLGKENQKLLLLF